MLVFDRERGGSKKWNVTHPPYNDSYWSKLTMKSEKSWNLPIWMRFIGIFTNNSKNIQLFSILMLALGRGGSKKIVYKYTPATSLWIKIDDEKKKMLK